MPRIQYPEKEPKYRDIEVYKVETGPKPIWVLVHVVLPLYLLLLLAAVIADMVLKTSSVVPLATLTGPVMTAVYLFFFSNSGSRKKNKRTGKVKQKPGK